MYRILSPTAILGYGFPEASFEAALDYDLDLIAVDAGSMDAGPYYLGSGQQYVGSAALKRDLHLIIAGALRKNCPLVIGSAGFSGSDAALEDTVRIVKEIVDELNPDSVRLSVIRSGVADKSLQNFYHELEPLGEMPELTADILAKSVVVGQMGMEPIITALDKGAQIVVCGRAYDPAIFAADAVGKGYPKGACLHAAKILECGAIACEPGSGSDCLIGEITRDGVARFFSLNPKRSVSIRSIAAHTLYEKSAPDLFRLPGGVLNIQKSQFSQESDGSVSVSGSVFQSRPYSVKLEGSQDLGSRMVSILPLKCVEGVDPGIRVYGRNGVEVEAAEAPIEELGLVVVAKARSELAAKDALAFVRSSMLHFGYEGRVSTAGNLAFPFSPSDLSLGSKGDLSGSLFVAGTRDPVFQKRVDSIIGSILEALNEQHPRLCEEARVEFTFGDLSHPIALLETVAETHSEAVEEHTRKAESLKDWIDPDRIPYSGINAGRAYSWSVHHLLKDMRVIKELFPIEMTSFDAGRWGDSIVVKPEYDESSDAVSDLGGDEGLNQIQDEPVRRDSDPVSLGELAKVVRSKNAGINEITYDVLLGSEADYRKALASGAFGPKTMSAFLGVDPDDVLGCYRYDPARAIKVTLKRHHLCGSPGERDTFGAQQHTRLLGIKI